MAYQVIPPVSGGGIKSVQRGLAGAAGTVTITAVNTAKAFVTVFGTTTSGTVVPSFTMNSASLSQVVTNFSFSTFGLNSPFGTQVGAGSGNVDRDNQQYSTTSRTITSPTINAGSNNLVAAVVQGYLSSTTALEVSGACRWEVVEFA
jgi:hypothetical protein